MEYPKAVEQEISTCMQAETEHLSMSQREKRMILNKLHKRNNAIGRFMERYITIPLNALVAGCAVVVISVFVILFPMLAVSEKDIQENKVIIIHQEGAV